MLSFMENKSFMENVYIHLLLKAPLEGNLTSLKVGFATELRIIPCRRKHNNMSMIEIYDGRLGKL